MQEGYEMAACLRRSQVNRQGPSRTLLEQRWGSKAPAMPAPGQAVLAVTKAVFVCFWAEGYAGDRRPEGETWLEDGLDGPTGSKLS